MRERCRLPSFASRQHLPRLDTEQRVVRAGLEGNHSDDPWTTAHLITVGSLVTTVDAEGNARWSYRPNVSQHSIARRFIWPSLSSDFWISKDILAIALPSRQAHFADRRRSPPRWTANFPVRQSGPLCSGGVSQQQCMTAAVLLAEYFSADLEPLRAADAPKDLAAKTFPAKSDMGPYDGLSHPPCDTPFLGTVCWYFLFGSGAQHRRCCGQGGRLRF